MRMSISLLALVFFLSSCSHIPPETLRILGAEEYAEVKRVIERFSAKRFQAFGSLSWKLPQGGGAANVVLLLDKPHFLRLQVQGPLGNSFGELVVREQAFWLHEKGKKFAWVGKLPFSSIKFRKEISPLSFLLSVNEAIRTFLRDPPLENIHLRKGRDSYVGISKEKENAPLPRYWLRWDLDGNLLEWKIRLSREKRLVLRYLEYKKWNGNPVPHRVEFHFLEKGEENKIFVWHWEKLFIPIFKKEKNIFSLPPVWAKDLPTRAL